MKIKKLLAAAFFCAAILCAMSVTGFAANQTVDTYEDLVSAIEQLEEGDTITLESGTYQVTANEQLSIKVDNVTIQGAGDDSVIDLNGYTCSGQAGILVSGNDVTLSNFKVTDSTWTEDAKSTDVAGIKVTTLSADDKTRVEGVNIDNVTVDHVFGHGINMHHANGVINNVDISNVKKVCVSIANADVSINNSNLQGTTAGWGAAIGLMWEDGNADYPAPSLVTLGEGNDITGAIYEDSSGVGFVSWAGTPLYHSTYANTGQGFYLDEPQTDVEYVTVTTADGNEVNYEDLAMAVEAAPEGSTVTLPAGQFDFSTIDKDSVFYINKPLTIKGNEAGTEVLGSIRIQSGDVTIDGLKFTEPVVLPAADNDPICIDINTGVYPDITIQNCTFVTEDKYQSDPGYRYKGIVTSLSGTYNNLQITNNTFINMETGIHLNQGASNVNISDNTAENSCGTFLKIEGADTASITDNIIGADVYIRPYRDGQPSKNITIKDNAFTTSQWLVVPAMIYMDYDNIAVDGGLDISQNYWQIDGVPSIDTCVRSNEANTPVTMTSYYTTYNPDAQEGEAMLSNLVQYITDPKKVAKEVVFEQVEGTNQFKVYLQGRATDEQGVATEDPATIINLVAVDFRINIEGNLIEEGGTDTYSFAFESFKVANENWQFHLEDGNRFLIYQKGDIDGNADLSGEEILLGTLTLGGYGEGTLKAEPGAEENTVEQRSDDGMNLVKSSMLSGEEFPFEIKAETATLNVKVQFNNEISDNPVEYQQMWAEITGGTLTETKVIEFGNDSSVVLNEDSYSFTCNDLIKGRKYTVAIKGEGYRTAHYTVTMDADEKNLSFWNNVKDAATVIETGADESTAVVKNYLAGDILKDNVIDIYDLSAVVSYFGEEGLNVGGETYNKGYAKYDLNRDGKIDSKDVAMVLVSWGK